jgi:hypothetical protein
VSTELARALWLRNLRLAAYRLYLGVPVEGEWKLVTTAAGSLAVKFEVRCLTCGAHDDDFWSPSHSWARLQERLQYWERLMCSVLPRFPKGECYHLKSLLDPDPPDLPGLMGLAALELGEVAP